MRLLLPPSEGKTRPVTGPALELEGLLGAPGLTPPREALIEELAALGDGQEAVRVLGLGARSAQEAGLNLVLRTAPCAPAHALYTGVLYEAAALSEAAREPGAESVLRDRVVILSGLWGAVRGTDLLPDHRLGMGLSLPAAGRLAAFWRPRLAGVLDPWAGGVVVDCRSGAYSPAWQPRTGWDGELVRVRVESVRPDGTRAVVSHFAKRARGLLAGVLVRALASASLSGDDGAASVAALGAGLPGVLGAELGACDRRGRRDLTLVTSGATTR